MEADPLQGEVVRRPRACTAGPRGGADRLRDTARFLGALIRQPECPARMPARMSGQMSAQMSAQTGDVCFNHHMTTGPPFPENPDEPPVGGQPPPPPPGSAPPPPAGGQPPPPPPPPAYNPPPSYNQPPQPGQTMPGQPAPGQPMQSQPMSGAPMRPDEEKMWAIGAPDIGWD